MRLKSMVLMGAAVAALCGGMFAGPALAADDVPAPVPAEAGPGTPEPSDAPQPAPPSEAPQPAPPSDDPEAPQPAPPSEDPTAPQPAPPADPVPGTPSYVG
ncbi:hypothetical protein [Marinactinospora rubrisoli]|uniref:Uncharacterized protein n=1 Tax=Marinactinospora rubrisoli TaxID=2715399 RepID=A0ABW2KGD4_9ACTN